MHLDNLHDLFILGMRDILDAENRLLKVNGQMARECGDPELAKALEAHQAETEGQIERLEEAFGQLDVKARRHTCTGVQGIIEEHKEFKDEKPAKPILAAYDIGAALKAESYEICCYESLIEKARMLGLPEIADILGQNLREEQAMFERVRSLAPRVLGAVMPQDLEEEDASEEEAAVGSEEEVMAE
jgi:ferritin-like metal-binding protein YciE